MGMNVDLRVGETLSLDGGRIRVTLLEKSGKRARIAVDASCDVGISLPDQTSHPERGTSHAQEMLAGSV